ncbi:MAG: alpha/beta hydrolase [Deltaproteobacteria bacterium]|jgi:uncharacterized protein
MEESRIAFDAGGPTLEGLLGGEVSGGAVVITHPHPLYGGDMQNPVVESVARACGQNGLASLRFNFRGVGGSEGGYDEGIGEQDDVKAAVAYLENLGASAIDLAGYSFGVWVNASAIQSMPSVNRMIMVSPPVNFMDFSFLQYDPRIRLVVAGARDDIGPAHRVEEMIRKWNPACEFRRIEGADHFYSGKIRELEAAISAFFDKEPQAVR